MPRYRWESPHTTPDDLLGIGLVESGQEFESGEPINHPYAVLIEDEKPAEKVKKE